MSTDKPLVLLVEDQDDIRADVREMLISLGHQVIEAASGEEALDLAGIEGIDLVLSDIMLGGAVTGDRLVGRIEAPVMLMSSLPQGDARRAGHAVLTKPFTRGQLAAFLADALAREAAE